MQGVDICYQCGPVSDLEALLAAIEAIEVTRDKESKLPTANPLRFMLSFSRYDNSRRPLRSILRICRRLKCQSYLIEDEYIGDQFFRDYLAVYASAFIPVSRYCKRIQFFSVPLTTEEVELNIIKGKWNTIELETSYLGYITVRPLPSYLIGKTVMRFDPEWRDEYDSPGLQGTPFLSCVVPETINLLGRGINIKNAIPFLQQDPLVGACSAASMWVTSYVFHKNYGKGVVSYSELSENARRVPAEASRANPWIRGHTVAQIEATLERCGIIVQVYRALQINEWLNTLYSIQESNLPVIAVLKPTTEEAGKRELHAVAIVGHICETPENLKKILSDQEQHREKGESAPAALISSPRDGSLQSRLPERVKPKNTKQLVCKGEIQRRYYAHDDSYGPYNHLDMCPNEGRLMVKRGRGGDENSYTLQALLICYPTSSIKLFPTEIVAAARTFLETFGIIEMLPCGCRVCLRPVLTKSNQFKEKLLPRRFPETIVEFYSRKHLPRYIWLVELSILQISGVVKESVIGELVFDSTSLPYRPYLICGRINGKLFTCDQNGSTQEIRQVPQLFYPTPYRFDDNITVPQKNKTGLMSGK